MSPNLSPHTLHATASGTACDASGYSVFSRGEIGTVHVFAHRALDYGYAPLGHQLLGNWLSRRKGSGSDWVHLQFHMALFELEIDGWRTAYRRMIDEILPVAESSDDALTDAPALVWRIRLQAPIALPLPWDGLRLTALSNLAGTRDSFVQLHNLLALAGAGDAESIDKWLYASNQDTSSDSSTILRRAGYALRELAAHSYGDAARRLLDVRSQIAQLGGSRAVLIPDATMATSVRIGAPRLSASCVIPPAPSDHARSSTISVMPQACTAR